MKHLDFVVIGAMKSGTTTLYEDLRKHPDIFLLDKESSLMAGAQEQDFPAPDTVGRIERALRPAPKHATCGEVATTYAMAPHFPGVVEAAATLPKTLQVIYIVREPVARIISHHHHDVSSGRLTVEIDEAVRSDPRLIDYTRYASQISPWVDIVGKENVLLIRFEDYMGNRSAGLARVLDFLGLEPLSFPFAAEVHNRSEGKPVAAGAWGAFVRSRLYRRVARPLLPARLRARAMKAVLPAAPPRPRPPSAGTIDLIHAELCDDQLRLAEMTGGPWWSAPPGSEDNGA